MLHPVVLKVPPFVMGLKGKNRGRALSVCARKSLLLSLEAASLSMQQILKNDRGVPVPSRGIHWAISHKETYVAGLGAVFPVGMDIEMIKPVKLPLFNKICSPGELRKFQIESQVHSANTMTLQLRSNLFFRIFTAKEAVLKSRGKGIAYLSHPKVVRVVDSRHLLVEMGGEVFQVFHYYLANHLASVAFSSRDLDGLCGGCEWLELNDRCPPFMKWHFA